MQQNNIVPEFKNIEEKNLMKIVALCSIFFTIVPPLVAYFGFPEKLTKASKQIVIALINFEITIVVAYVICGFIPLLGFVLVAVPMLINLIVCLKVISAIANKTSVSIPIFIPFLQLEEDEVTAQENKED